MEYRKLKGYECPYTYSHNEADADMGCVGHMRGEFNGVTPYSFWSTWFPHQQNRLSVPKFELELGRIMRGLRGNILESLPLLKEFCESSLDRNFADAGYGMCIESENYRYLLRLDPDSEKHQFYMYCYEKKPFSVYLLSRMKEEEAK